MLESFRLACDRCRSHKLKCSQNTSTANSGACQRCLRAKVQCTFSPRARTGRPSERKSLAPLGFEQKPEQKRRRRSKITETSYTDLDFDMEDFSGDEADDSQVRVSKHDLDVEPLTSNNMPVSPWDHFEDYSLEHPQQTPSTQCNSSSFDLNTIENLLNGTNMNSSLYPDTVIDDNLAQSLLESPFEEGPTTWNSPQELNTSSPMPQMAPPVGLSMHSGLKSMSEAIFQPSGTGSKNDYCTQRLSVLANALHQHLTVVNEGQWGKSHSHQGQQPCLENYPIGDILHHSQELISVLSSVSEAHTNKDQQNQETLYCAEKPLQNSCSYDNIGYPGSPPAERWPVSPISELDPTHQRGAANLSSRPDIETPVALLILTCYVSLIRTYNVVFLHLHHCLCSVPSLSTTCSTTLQIAGVYLGELKPFNDECIRAHAAFRMLLDTLGQIEDILGLPWALRCVRIFDAGVPRTGKRYKDAGCTAKGLRANGQNETSSSDEGSSRSSHNSAADSDTSGSVTVGLVRMELVEAVLRQEVLIGADHGGGGLNFLRQNIMNVKQTLRQKMAL